MRALHGSFTRFSVCVEFSTVQVVLLVRGELDRLTAPELGRMVAAMVAGGHRQVVLDLAQCDFIDASGLRVIAEGAEYLDLWGGELAVRSPSGIVRRLLDLVGLPDLVDLSSAVSVPAGVVALEASSEGGLLRAQPPLTAITAVPAGDDAVDAALRLVVALARVAVGPADGVSVSLRRHGRLSTVAASDQTVQDMDADQYATGEGPCVDASAQGTRFYAQSLLTETRWPNFTPQALGLGIRSILSSPLVVRDRPVGALNIYARTPAAFAETDKRLASTFASEASAVLVAAGVGVSKEELAGRVDLALRTRQVIALAQGVMMERIGVDEDQAYTALRRFSALSSRPLRERAEDIVASTRRLGAELSAGTEEDRG